MIHHHLKTARVFSKLMDNQFSFMGIGFGLDNILGLVPGLGDVVSLCLSFYLVWIGWQMKLPSEKLSKMVGNVLVDTFIGTLPLIGDIGDLFFKANVKNLAILETHFEQFYGQVVEGEIVGKAVKK